VAVERLAVGESELRTLDDGVDVVDGAEAHALEVETVEERQLLQEDGRLTPRSRLADGRTAELPRDRALDCRRIGREVVPGQEAAVSLAHSVTGVGDEPAIPDVAGPLDLVLARPTP